MNVKFTFIEKNCISTDLLPSQINSFVECKVSFPSIRFIDKWPSVRETRPREPHSLNNLRIFRGCTFLPPYICILIAVNFDALKLDGLEALFVKPSLSLIVLLLLTFNV